MCVCVCVCACVYTCVRMRAWYMVYGVGVLQAGQRVHGTWCVVFGVLQAGQ